MFDRVGQYNFILFTPDLDFEPTSESIGDLLEIFKGKNFLPNTNTVFIQGIDTGPRLQLEFKSKDSAWNLLFEKTRVSLLHKPKDRKPLDKIEYIIDEVCDIFYRLDKYCPFLGTRMAYLIKGLLPEMDDELLKSLQYSFLNTISFYEENPSCEWSTRQVSRYNLKIDDKLELSNIITEIRRTQCDIEIESVLKHFDRIEVMYDFNTFQENKKRRFAKEHIEQFLKESINMYEIINRQISEIVYGP